MADHPFIAELTRGWSAERRQRFKAMLEERAADLPAGKDAMVSAHSRPVPRDEIDRLAPVGLRIFEELAQKLGLDPAEKIALLGLPSSAAIPKPYRLSEEQFYRLSYLIGIYIDVGGLLGKEGAIRWFRVACSSGKSAGRSPVTYLIETGLPGFEYLRREAGYWAENGW
ncbi:MAG: hypothetical protein EOO76_07100 [Novosphingobium sp.]|nr:MAG: hypothetical protein EOO76_07100 [Novosphingobium sp.]